MIGQRRSRGEISDRDGMRLTIDAGHFMTRQEFNVEPFFHRRGSLDQQLTAIRNDATYVIR